MGNTVLDLAPYLVGLTVAGLALILFMEMKRMQQEFQLRWNQRQQNMNSELGKLRSTVQELRTKVEEAERRAETMVAPNPPTSGLNLSRRTQAIRLLSRGEAPEQIALRLQLPKQEVELLQKVHRIVTVPQAVGATVAGARQEIATAARHSPASTPIRPTRPTIPAGTAATLL